MAELVACIIGISGAALKLSSGLYKVASALKNAGQEVRIIANDTAQFSRSLKELSQTLESDVPAMARARNVAEDVIATCLSIQEDGEKLLTVLKPLVEQSGKAFSRAFISVRWLFERSKFAYHRELLSSLKSTLQLLVSVVILETVPNRDMFSHLVEEVVNLRHVVQSGMYCMEQHLQSSQLMEASQPRTGSIPNLNSNVGLLAIEGPSTAGTEMTASDSSETTNADETPSSSSSSTMAVRSEEWELETFQDAVEAAASPAAGHVGPLALLPYFRAYLAQGKVCQYMDEAFRLMHYDQDGNMIDGHPDSREAASAPPPSSKRENPAQMTPAPESSVEIAATLYHSQSVIDVPQNNVINPLTVKSDHVTDRQAEIEERTPIAALHRTGEPIPQLPIEGERVNPRLEISRVASSSALESSLSESDGMVNGAESPSRISSQGERQAESTIQQDPSSTPFDLSSTDANVANSASDVPEMPSTTSSPQSEDDILQESDPDVVYLMGPKGEGTPMPFRKCRTYEGLVETVKLYGFGNKLKSPYWRSAILESIDRMYRGSLTSTEQLTRRTGLGPNYKTWIPSRELTPSNRLFLHRRSIFEDSFIPVLSENWAEFACPDTVIKINFDREDLRQLFDSHTTEAIRNIIGPEVKEVEDQGGHDREFQNQQAEVHAATVILEPEETRPSAQSKFSKRINFLRRH